MSGKTAIFMGFAAIVVLFVAYSRYQNPEMITPEAFDYIQRLAYGFYAVFASSLICIAYGLYSYHRKKLTDDPKIGLVYVIAFVTNNSRARVVFIITLIVYGIFFTLTSGTLVYQPEVDFSYHYGVQIPSAQIIPCCDVAGYMPKILVYLDEHIGLQIIPLNLILQTIVSYLVALNTAIVVGVTHISKKKKGITSAGAAAGLFIACPTCVGSIFSVFVGVAGGIILTATLVQIQTLLIVASIPILIVMPFIIASRIQNRVCNTQS
ncbi:MAG: putative membrane protein [Cenarchaeum symbiont of Oopsacas minuta]|nr:putative membrane protein [Cenarchaeum symbiont of Oopsacas minuta]